MRRGYSAPFHVHIASVFIALLVIAGVVLIWFNFVKTNEVIISASEGLASRIAREVALDFDHARDPIAAAVNMLAHAPITRARTFEDRLESLPVFQSAVDFTAKVSAVQIGYESGDFFVLRRLRTDYMREHFAAPNGAVYMADHLGASADGGRRDLRLFFDRQLAEIARRPLDDDYSPTTTVWYAEALVHGQTMTTHPFVYHFIGKLGVAVARRTERGDAVVAADISLEDLSVNLAGHRLTRSTQLVAYQADGTVLAFTDLDALVTSGPDGAPMPATLSTLGSPVISALEADLRAGPTVTERVFGHEQWLMAVHTLDLYDEVPVYIALLAPQSELSNDALEIREHSAYIAIALLVLMVPIIWLVSRAMSTPLKRLAIAARRIQQFDFSRDVKTDSIVKEIADLALGMQLMQTTIGRFLGLINSLAAESDFEKLLELIAHETREAANADAAIVYLIDDDEAGLRPAQLELHGGAVTDPPTLPHLDRAADAAHPVALGAEATEPIIRHAGAGTVADPQIAELFASVRLDPGHMVVLPLRDRQGQPIGSLCLLFAGTAATTDANQLSFERALSGFAAVSLESRQLLKAQKDLLDAFIRLIAGAIDAKSPYTGGHCQRVPDLTMMLARAACDSEAAPIRDYDLSDEDWEALRIAAWLHDCGKVTTPEYVVDKATKLETVYDRIHELRMRFEVLKRDAEITCWKAVAGGADAAAERQRMADQHQTLDDEFAFVATCNVGGEFLADEDVQRLHQIGERRWMRTLNDRLGVSWEEADRKDRTPDAALPAEEKLIADKDEHLIFHAPGYAMDDDNKWGFKLNVPKHKLNRGELYSLSIGRGTLTDEERFIINDHIVQTIIMLEELPFPKHLRAVPEMAGGHHEKMDGTGYPRRLKASDMSVTARIMAIADIFEALTASDRPYKKAKTLSESLKIMSFMRKDAHIDPDLFDLFLSSGVYKTYADKYLDPQQIDEVDVDQYLNPAPAGA